MNAGNAQGDWTFFNTSGEYSIVAQADGQAGRVIQLGNNAGNDIVWMHPNNFIPLMQLRHIDFVRGIAVVPEQAQFTSVSLRKPQTRHYT